MKKLLLILAVLLSLSLVGCKKEIKDVNGNNMHDEDFDIYSLQPNDALEVLKQSEEDNDIVQNTLDVLSICQSQLDDIIIAYQDGNTKEFKKVSKEMYNNCNKLVKIIDEKNNVLEEKIKEENFELYSKSLKRCLDVLLNISEGMLKVDNVDEYEFNFERVNLLLDEHFPTFMESTQHLEYK